MSDRIDVILDLTKRLSNLVEREIALIEAREPHRIGELEEERSRLSLLYTREMQAVQADPASVRQGGKDRIERLKAETKNFNASLDRHQRLVARMRRVTEGIVKAIADEATRQKTPKTVYGATGTAAYGNKAAPIAVNRKI